MDQLGKSGTEGGERRPPRVAEIETFDRKGPEEQLRFQAQLLDGVRESIVATDLQGNITYWGKGAETLYGYTARETRGRSITMIVRPEDAPEEVARMRRVLETGCWKGEYRQRRKDGTTFWADTHISLVTDRAGRPCGFIGIDRDITDRKEAEEKAERLHNELAHVSRVTTMGELAAGLAHELNQPLTTIAGYARACIDGIAGEQAGQLARLASIAAEADRAGEIIRRLWDLVSKREPRRASTDANELVREIGVLLAREARRRRVTLRLDLADRVPPVTVDRIQIQQVILNLVRNALDAMRRVPHAERRITIATRAAERLHLEVRDNGPGIPPELAGRIFEPFFTTRPDGLGMGLSISRSIVEAHGGTIEAREAEGGGTVFVVTLG